jgi:hypothetical protein
MDFVYLELVLQDFTLKQLSMINWFNNNLDENIHDRYSKILDLLRETTGTDLTDWTPLKIQQGLMAAKELGILSRDQEKDMRIKLKTYLVSSESANSSIEPYAKTCCGSDLKIVSGRNITVFGTNYSYASKTMAGICNNCDKRYSHNFFINDKEKIVTRESFSNNNIIYFGGNYAYEKSFIKSLTNSIMYLYSGFENFTKCFNATKQSLAEKLDDDSLLSPARVQDFWFTYNFINCSFFYTKDQAIKIPSSW